MPVKIVTLILLITGCIASTSSVADDSVSAMITITVNLQKGDQFPSNQLTQNATRQCAERLKENSDGGCPLIIAGFQIIAAATGTLRLEPI